MAISFWNFTVCFDICLLFHLFSIVCICLSLFLEDRIGTPLRNLNTSTTFFQKLKKINFLEEIYTREYLRQESNPRHRRTFEKASGPVAAWYRSQLRIPILRRKRVRFPQSYHWQFQSRDYASRGRLLWQFGTSLTKIKTYSMLSCLSFFNMSFSFEHPKTVSRKHNLEYL